MMSDVTIELTMKVRVPDNLAVELLQTAAELLIPGSEFRAVVGKGENPLNLSKLPDSSLKSVIKGMVGAIGGVTMTVDAVTEASARPKRRDVEPPVRLESDVDAPDSTVTVDGKPVTVRQLACMNTKIHSTVDGALPEPLDVRTVNGLRNRPMIYYGETLAHTKRSLLGFSLGRKSVDRLDEYLRKGGLYLGADVEGWEPPPGD